MKTAMELYGHACCVAAVVVGCSAVLALHAAAATALLNYSYRKGQHAALFLQYLRWRKKNGFGDPRP